nr:hypothetical protein [Tanacetum cinerariifolium]
MINAEVDDSNKGDEEVTDAAKADAEETLEVKDDGKKPEIPPTSFSLFMSSGFNDYFLNFVLILLCSHTRIRISFKTIVTNLPPPSVSTTPSVPQQTTTPIPTPTITTHALIITIAIFESDALFAAKLKVSKLEKYVFDNKKIDLSIKALAALKTQVPFVIDNYLGSKVGDTMHANKSFNQNLANHQLYHALIEALTEDENAMDKGVAYTVQDHKTKHDDDQDDDDEDPPAGPNQGSKTGKYAPSKEPVKEHIAEVGMDDASNDVVHDDDQPQDDFEPKTTNTSNPDWFKQPPCLLLLIWNGTSIRLYLINANSLSSIKWSLLQRILSHLTTSWPLRLTSPSHLDHLTIAIDYFFNNDMEYLNSYDPERTYTTSITKTKATRYKIKGIEDMGKVLKLWRISQLNKFSKHNVYSTKKILGVKSVSVKKLHGYGHLEEIMMKRANRQFYMFKEGSFVDLHPNDIEDMLLLAVQHKVFHLADRDIVDFIVALCMSTRSLIIKKRIKDLQLGAESYRKKLNITLPLQTFSEIEFKELYTPSHKPPRLIYEDLTKQKRVMRVDELYKFSDGTLKKVRDELHHRIHDFCLEYNTKMPRRK